MILPVVLALSGPTPQVAVATVASWDAGGSCYVRAEIRRLDRRISGPVVVEFDAGDSTEMCIGYDEQLAWLSRRRFSVQFEFPGLSCRDIRYLNYGVLRRGAA